MVVLPPVQEPAEFNSNFVLFWNHVALEFNRLTHSATISGPQTGPPISARSLGIFHLAINDAYFGIQNPSLTYLRSDHADPAYRLPPVLGATDARMAVNGAAITVLEREYTEPRPGVSSRATAELTRLLQDSIAAVEVLDALSSSYRFGVAVGNAITNLLEIGPDEPGSETGNYRPQPGRFRFDVDPTNPLQMPEAPFYGMTAKRLSVQHQIDGRPTEHINADPPVGFGTNDVDEYEQTLWDTVLLGGAPDRNETRRTPEQTVQGFFWAYDGSNLLGSPARFYNLIIRRVAWKMMTGGPDEVNADFVRLFALANVALADAGIFAWQEKYCFEFWRPLSGVREEPGRLGDPFFLTLGAPNTNTQNISFKPPFPAYPSGHATFGGAAFQIVRLFYRQRDGLGFEPDSPDAISFDMVSEELNGVSRDLRQPYDPSKPITAQNGTVRTFVQRSFASLWEAMFENAVSRVYLGVHWLFDAAASEDVRTEPILRGEDAQGKGAQHRLTTFMDAANIRYRTLGPRADRPNEEFPIGGVPLGIGIANDIFGGGLSPTPQDKQPTGRDRCGNPNLFGAGREDGKLNAPGSGEANGRGDGKLNVQL